MHMGFWTIFILIILSAIIIGIGILFHVGFWGIFTIEGLLFSVYGVVLTLIQVMHLQKITKATETAVKETRGHIKLVLSVAQTAKNVSDLRYVKECITNDKFELARLKLGDVKDFLSEIGYIEGLTYDKSLYKKLVNSMESNMYSLEQAIHGTQLVDKNIFCKDVERVVAFLIDVENKLKS